MEYEDETLRLYVLIQDNPDLTVGDAVKSVRGGRSLRDAAYLVFMILIKNLDYRKDQKFLRFYRSLSVWKHYI